MLHLLCRVRVIGQPEGTLKQCSGNRTVCSGRRIDDPEVEPVLGECIIANALIGRPSSNDKRATGVCQTGMQRNRGRAMMIGAGRMTATARADTGASEARR